MFVIIICSIGYQPFPLFVTNTKKKSVNFLSRIEALVKPLMQTKMLTDNTASVFAFFRIKNFEIYQISILQRKAKTLLCQYVIMSIYLFCLFKLW